MSRKKMVAKAYKHYMTNYPMPSYYKNGDTDWYYRCYMSIAAEEIVAAIENIGAVEDVLDMLQCFMENYNDACCSSTFDQASFMFSIAADVASSFIDLYLS